MFFIPFGLVTVEIDCSVNPLITNLAVRLLLDRLKCACLNDGSNFVFNMNLLINSVHGLYCHLLLFETNNCRIRVGVSIGPARPVGPVEPPVL